MIAILKCFLHDNGNSVEIHFSRQIQNYFKARVNSNQFSILPHANNPSANHPNTGVPGKQGRATHIKDLQ
jgi:hypothetical protein